MKPLYFLRKRSNKKLYLFSGACIYMEVEVITIKMHKGSIVAYVEGRKIRDVPYIPLSLILDSKYVQGFLTPFQHHKVDVNVGEKIYLSGYFRFLTGNLNSKIEAKE